ncbi:TetR/AcrR family transcriptional regulator [Puniceibacterium sediminis]|uniref:Transcriptional regulator, TetR family n=1 Tax=Puniceibacterium sediminis TaxID=1608407 RepID=A0A238WDG2_9RHOB|nr:TetR/AcrR family transcriptional regulator [Puniceibacterium sediminis]SNR44314.1 transcriptional regulator, TetR family [Puniceibacterium sediminis]
MPREPAYDRDVALNTAMSLFWAKGYHTTSMRDLELALKMRPGSIYAAFHNKEGLFRATLELYAKRMEADLSRQIEESASPLGALQRYLLSLGGLERCEKPSTACMLVKSLLEIHEDQPELRDVVLGHLECVRRLLAEGFEKARLAGELPMDVDTDRLARRMQTYVFGLKIQAQRETDPAAMQHLVQDLADEFARLGHAA